MTNEQNPSNEDFQDAENLHVEQMKTINSIDDAIKTFIIPDDTPVADPIVQPDGSAISPIYGARYVPWDYIGTPVVNFKKSIPDALQEVGLNWTVLQRPVWVDGKIVPQNRANVRSDTRKVLKIVGLDYTPVQNATAFGVLQNLLQDDNLEITKVLIFGEGRRVAVVVKSNPFTVLGDSIEPFMVVSNSFDGTTKLQFALTPVRIVCQNTLTLALKTAKRIWSATHTQSIEERIIEAAEALELTTEYYSEFPTIVEWFAETNLSAKEEMTIAETLFPFVPSDGKRKKERQLANQNLLIATYKNTPDIKKFEGSALGMYYAITDMIQHRNPGKKMKNTMLQNELRAIDTIEGNEIIDKGQKLLMAIASQ